ncbi:MAG: M23 family metallopeptidase, partial [Candidatus Latescibacteria bacterium]|nr:M23 family metallopeptidase [Candidatus Latescibacterota bacterium]
MIVTAFFHTIFRRFYRSVNLSFLPLFRLNYTFIILGCLSPDNIIAQEIPWPIDSPKRISSSFGEPRPGRFHFGVDFKSGGVTGKKVYAIGDGYISHVQTSPFGYGKGLYLTLDSGKTAVYGHLSGFLPEIEDRLFRMRISKKTYDVKLWFKPDEFKVRQGQVIAYSGDTGSGAPHLHLELRDEKNIPLNLLDYGLVVHDDIPPVLDSVMLIPFDKTSSIDGSS